MITVHRNITNSLQAIKNSTEKLISCYTERLISYYYYPHFIKLLKTYHERGIENEPSSPFYTISPTTTYTPTYRIISTSFDLPYLDVKLVGITKTPSGIYQVVYKAGKNHPIYHSLKTIAEAFSKYFPYINSINIYSNTFKPIITTATIPLTRVEKSLKTNEKDHIYIHQNLTQSIVVYKLNIGSISNGNLYMAIAIKSNSILYIIYIVIAAVTFTILISIYTTFKLSETLAHKLAQPLAKITNVITKLKPPYENAETIINQIQLEETPEELWLLIQKIKEMIQANHKYLKQIENERSKTLLAYGHASKREQELYDAYYNFATTLAKIAEKHDDITGKHIQRVGEISGLIAEKLQLPSLLVDQIRKFAPLHDIGKIMVPDKILQKKGPLTEEEWEIMKRHTKFGAELIGNKNHFMVARNIALYHHEKYDGSGYPFGLKGNQIPIEAQIVALADIYDALRDERPYKPALTHDEAVKIILYGDKRTKPEHFNPQILEIFAKYHKEIEQIYEKLK